MRQYNPKLGYTLNNFSVDLDKCRERTDFGKGFYLTTSFKQARDWANSLALRDEVSSKKATQAAVLEFSVDLDQMSCLESIWFVYDSTDFVKFIKNCRDGKDHSRSLPNKFFDMVSGPVTMFPQESVLKDSDQVSFHTTQAVSVLGQPKLIEMGSASGMIPSPYIQ
jgi:hypothetical protein